MKNRIGLLLATVFALATGCVVDNPIAYDPCKTVKDCSGTYADSCITVTQYWGSTPYAAAMCTTQTCSADAGCSRSGNGLLGFCSQTAMLGTVAGTCFERCYTSADCSVGFQCANSKDIVGAPAGVQLCVPASPTPIYSEAYWSCGSVSECDPSMGLNRCETIDPKWDATPDSNAQNICTKTCFYDTDCPFSYNDEPGYCAPGGELSDNMVCLERCDFDTDCLQGFRCAMLSEIAGLPESTDRICVPDPAN